MLVGAIVAAGFVGWNRWVRTAGPKNPGFACTGVVHARARVPLAAGDVHRVALIGDSIMEQASCTIGDSLADVGIDTYRHGVSGSGLLAGMDWLAAARKVLRTDKPDVVIAIFVGNYLFGSATDNTGTAIKENSPEFFRAWQARAEKLSAEVRAAGARLYWVSPPPIRVPPLTRAARLFAGYETIEGDHFLQSGEALTGPNGSVVMAKKTCGRTRAIRTEDRVHLTEDGARIYGQQIAHDLTADLGLVSTPRPC